MIRVCKNCGVFLDSSRGRKRRKNCPMCGLKLRKEAK
jgi:predicted RNA-binding Zn ribbon-like protein